MRPLEENFTVEPQLGHRAFERNSSIHTLLTSGISSFSILWYMSLSSGVVASLLNEVAETVLLTAFRENAFAMNGANTIPAASPPRCACHATFPPTKRNWSATKIMTTIQTGIGGRGKNMSIMDIRSLGNNLAKAP